MPQKEKVDPRIDKRRITMKNVTLLPNGVTATQEAVDYVRPDHLSEYIREAQSKWQYVSPASYEEAMQAEPDAGPGGYDGPTSVPEHLSALPDAGVLYEGNEGWEDKVDLTKAAPADEEL